ncbi:MAG: di-heme oxidoredictase family protein, partial [Pseudomonadota bacterium]
MIFATVLGACGATVLASSDFALDDRHLSVVPRTPAEQARIDAVTKATSDFSQPERFEPLPAGAATVRVRRSRDAFSDPSGNISFEGELDFKVGNGLFRKLWVAAPASTRASDGLGPVYNARSCQRCHLKDGRGHPPETAQDNAISMFLRISIPGGDAGVIDGTHPTLPDPNYGRQMQDFAVPGVASEYRLGVTWEEIEIPLSDGEVAQLRRPAWRATDLGYGPLHAEAMLSPRIAPQMIGLGLLEAIPAADILANADPDDADGDGISGRPNIVMSREHGVPMLGRFGLKAGSPTLREQSASAFAGDIGISNPLFPDNAGECMAAQSRCQDAPDGAHADEDGFEVGNVGLDLVTFYSRNLGVPARRAVDDPAVLRGKEMFYQSG